MSISLLSFVRHLHGNGSPKVKEGDWEIAIPVLCGMTVLVIIIYFIMRKAKKGG